MNSPLFNSVVLTVCGILFCLIMSDVSGQWAGNVKMNGQNYPVNYDFKVEGDKLTGISETPLGKSVIESGRISNDMISFKLNIKGEMVQHRGRVYADSVVLSIDYHGQDLHATLIRNSGN